MVNEGALKFSVIENAVGGDVLGDVDGDGDLDVIGLEGGGVSVLFNDGGGGLVSASLTPEHTSVGSVAAADIDGDSDKDFVIGNGSTIRNDGNGDFFVQTGAFPGGAFALGDLDNDGDIDIAALGGPSRPFTISLNTGDGQSFVSTVSMPITRHDNQISLSDMDNDGDLDVVTVNQTSADISVLFNNGDGSFAPQQSFDVAPRSSRTLFPQSLAIADVDGDGAVNIADLMALLRLWGGHSVANAADIDKNGSIGPGDLLALLSSFDR